MNANDLLDLIGEARDDQIIDAAHIKKPVRWKRWAAVAACLLLVIGGISLLREHPPGANSGNGNGDADLSYMAYYGPVLPLTTKDDTSGITVQRDIDFNFSPYANIDQADAAIVTDCYTLQNDTDADATMTLLYPIVGDLRNWEDYPTVTVDREEVETSMHPGPYAGGFTGELGAENAEGTFNLKKLDSFEGFAALLADGGYQDACFDDFPALDQKVAVYRMHDYVYTADTEATNPTLEMAFQIDYDKTFVFTYNMNGASFDAETGRMTRRSSSIKYKPNVAPERQHPEDAYLIILGEDLQSYTIQGYRDGGCNEGEELHDLSCTVTRYETTLGDILEELMEDFLKEYIRSIGSQLSRPVDTAARPDLAMYCGLAAELLKSYGIIGEEPMQRYDAGFLEDIYSAVCNNTRVIYFSFEVTIPAGSAVTLEAKTLKRPSMDFVGSGVGIDGYDMATTLGSTLHFTEQTASISGFGAIEITGQSFGFDPSTGLTHVTLDQNTSNYWLQIRKIPKEE